MRAVIICGGTVLDYGYVKGYIKEDDMVICADSGYDHAVKMGIKPCIAVGDFDSASVIPTDVETIRYNSRKNLTDSEIALQYARDKGIKDFLFIAATGTRLDHTLTNIYLLTDCLKRGENAVIIDEHNKIMITDAEIHLCEPVGTIVSIIPLTEECHGVKTENLEYPLEYETLYQGQGRGVSNCFAGNEVRISVKSGILLIIVAND